MRYGLLVTAVALCGAVLGTTAVVAQQGETEEGEYDLECDQDPASQGFSQVITLDYEIDTSRGRGAGTEYEALREYYRDSPFKGARPEDFRRIPTDNPDVVRFVYERDEINMALLTAIRTDNGWIIPELEVCDSLT